MGPGPVGPGPFVFQAHGPWAQANPKMCPAQMDPAQLVPGPKRDLGPNRTWTQTGYGPKQALGPSEPWAQWAGPGLAEPTILERELFDN